MSRLEQWYRTPDAYKAKYEELMKNPTEELKSISTYLDLSVDEIAIEQVVEQHSFRSLTGRNPGEEEKESPQRKGIVGDWKNYFNKDCMEAFKNEKEGRWNSLLIEMGYEKDLRWGF